MSIQLPGVGPPGVGDPAGAPAGNGALPSALPVLPLRDNVSFPSTVTPLAIGQERSIRLVNEVLGGNRMLTMVASREPELETPGPEQLHEVGVVGVVARMMKVPDGTLHPRPGHRAGAPRPLRRDRAVPDRDDRA